MQTAGKLVIFIGKFSARMQLGQNHLDAGNALLGMYIDRHAPAIIADQHRAVFIQDHINCRGMACHRLIDTVIDDFLHQMVGPCGVRVHAGTLSYRLQSA